MTDRTEIGRRGNAAARAADPDHQSKAGKAAIQSVAAKYANGSIDDWMAYLRSRQTTYQLDQAADQQNAKMLANGREIASVELPVVCEPEDDVFWQEMVTRKGRGQSRAG